MATRTTVPDWSREEALFGRHRGGDASPCAVPEDGDPLRVDPELRGVVDEPRQRRGEPGLHGPRALE